ncbi:MAG: nucleotidyltransferase family protein [Pseudomonadota bacterium]
MSVLADTAAAPAPWSGDGEEAFLAHADLHGTAALLLQRWPERVPAASRPALMARLAGQVAWEHDHQRLVAPAIEALAAADCEPLVFKGTALAYSLYDAPHQRTRGDTDILVPEAVRERACQVLAECGFAEALRVSGEAVSQTTFERADGHGAHHAIDLHWQIDNAPVVARVLGHQSLWAHAVPLPRLCASAMGPGLADALIIAAIHRKKHSVSPYLVGDVAHYDENRLIWLYDVDILARAMAAADWAALTVLALQRQVAETVRDALTHTTRTFQTPVPDSAWEALDAAPSPEPLSIYFTADAPRRALMDLRASGLRQGTRRLWDIAFPPAAYLRQSANSTKTPLPILYARRIWRGGLKAFRHKAASR